MKRVGRLYERMCSFDHLYLSFKKAFKGSGRTVEACRFHFHLEKELLLLQRELETGRYQPGQYRYFRIKDPKERTISVAPFRDRVVHHALVGVLEPFIERRFIYDSYANRKGKGTHRAVRRAQTFLKKNEYYLKTDISKYFDSIDHEILLGQLQRLVKDRKILELAGLIVNNSDRSRNLQQGKALPIGNLTSQFFANLYLNPFDHFIKEELGVKCYLRYMDDLVVFAPDCEDLKELLIKVQDWLKARLHLNLKPKATFINTRRHGLSFLGFRIFPNLIRIRRENLKRMKQRLKEKERQRVLSRISEEELSMSAQSMLAHLSFADSLALRKSIFLSVPGPPWERDVLLALPAHEPRRSGGIDFLRPSGT